MNDEPAATITAYPDGPLIVRGSYQVLDAAGKEIEVTRRAIALCRCGKSSQKPWCDGTHKAAKFQAD